jgi:ribosomal protein S18 acetylase RimI-like enzyme
MDAPKIKVRNMVDADLPSVQPLLRQLGYELALNELEHRFSLVVKSPEHSAFVCETGGKVVGSLHISGRPALEKPAEAIIQSIVVDQAYRKVGIGNELMAAAEHWATEQGYGSITLYTRTDRDDAHAFYSQMDYRTKATAHLLQKGLR